MKGIKLNRDQIQKIVLSIMGFIFLLFVYSHFFLGPLNRSRNTMLATIKDKQSKLDSSKGELAKAATLEQQAKNATVHFTALKGSSPEGAPIAWFPPRMRLFFANQHIDKAVARMDSTSSFKEPELASWFKYTWVIDLPQTDYSTAGKAIAELENAEPLMSITKLTIRSLAEQPQFQQVAVNTAIYIPKK
jgi:hypothetical protein